MLFLPSRKRVHVRPLSLLFGIEYPLHRASDNLWGELLNRYGKISAC